jgi:hypothetical protein
VHLLMLHAVLDESDHESALTAAGQADGHAHCQPEGPLDAVTIRTTRCGLCSSVIEPILFNDSGSALDLDPDQKPILVRSKSAAVRQIDCHFRSYRVTRIGKITPAQ